MKLNFPSSLDEMLNGGLLSGNLIDICGLSATGKTILHTTIAINAAINHDSETIVIDSNGDFSGDRIYRMLVNRKIGTESKCREIMQHIRVVKCTDPIELINIIKALIEQAKNNKKFKILVIDSLPAIWFKMYGMRNFHAYKTIVALAHQLRKLAVEHAIIILTVNIVTASTSYEKKLSGELIQTNSSLSNFLAFKYFCFITTKNNTQQTNKNEKGKKT